MFPRYTWALHHPLTERQSPEINTYFKETQFDLASEGHARMVMKGGYGTGTTDNFGNI